MEIQEEAWGLLYSTWWPYPEKYMLANPAPHAAGQNVRPVNIDIDEEAKEVSSHVL